MKKRLVAVTLGVILSLSTVGEAGASVFSSPEDTAASQDEIAGSEAAESETDSAETADTSEVQPEDSGAEDLFSAGEYAGTSDAEPQDSSSAFSSGEDETQPAAVSQITDAVPAEQQDDSDAVSVKAEDWIREDDHFKLRKPVKKDSADTSDAAPADTVQTEDQTGEVVLTDSDTDETDNADSTDPTQADAADTEILTAEDPDYEDTADTTEDPVLDVSDDSADGDANASTDPADNTDSFYTAADGLVKISTEYKEQVHTGWYLFDENGYMVTGQAQVNPEQGTDIAAAQTADASDGDAGIAADTEETVQSCFTSAEDAVVYTGCENEAVTPYTSTVGQQIRNKWKWTGTAWQYYNAAGTLETVTQLEAAQKANGTYTGYFKIENEYYSLKADGTPRTGNVTLTVNGVSNLYYFEKDSTIPGRMFHEGWRVTGLNTSRERWLYYSQGKNPADIGKYYQRGVIATRLDENIKGAYTYLISSKGYLLKSTIKKAENGAFYGTDKYGRIYTNKMVLYKGYRYYFGKTGKRATWKNRWAKVNNHYYYFGGVPGRVLEKHGWQKLTNTKNQFLGWIYLDQNGNNYTNKWTSNGYYFKANGKLASGLTQIGTKMYLFESSTAAAHKGKVYKNTMIRYKKKLYLASATGALYKGGWRQYNNGWYYLRNYTPLTNQFRKKNGVNGYLNSSGKYTTGWVLVSDAKNLMRYIDPTGNGYAKNTSKWINGVLYYFDSNGYRITDVSTKYPNGPYYLEVQRKNGVMTVYTDSTKRIPIKTIRVSVGVPSTPTPPGEYTLRSSARWQLLMGPSWGQYGTHVERAGKGGIYVHSIACAQANSFNLPAVEYNKLGQPASHGCIRACVADAKWVYYHCNGSRINIIDGVVTYHDAYKGPLGKNPLTPLRGAKNFDPTDPEV